MPDRVLFVKADGFTDKIYWFINGICAQNVCRIAFRKHLKTPKIVLSDKIQIATQQIIEMAPVAKIVT